MISCETYTAVSKDTEITEPFHTLPAIGGGWWRAHFTAYTQDGLLGARGGLVGQIGGA